MISDRNHSLFIAFAPIDHPKIAVAVVAENCTIAPIVARKIIDTYLHAPEKPKPIEQNVKPAQKNNQQAETTSDDQPAEESSNIQKSTQ
jgi:cell division protein FtsI/penicillin-binding protein 2